MCILALTFTDQFSRDWHLRCVKAQNEPANAAISPSPPYVLLAAVLPHISVVLLSVSHRWFLTVLPQGFTLEFFGRALNSEMGICLTTSTAFMVMTTEEVWRPRAMLVWVK